MPSSGHSVIGSFSQAMTFRSPSLTDAQAVLALLVERDILDIGAPDITLEDLREEWCRRDFDLSADARVVDAADGRIVGYAAMTRPVTVIVVVAPDHEGRGIGSRLRHWAEERDRARGSSHHRQWIAAGNRRGRALLLAAGYRPERSYWRLGRMLDDIEERGSPPAGISLRPVDIDEDAAALHALNDVSFKASPDYQPYSFGGFYEEHLRAHDLDRELSYVAERDGQPIGFLLARRWRQQNVGFIDLLGVHPDHRTQGLGTAMLQTAFARFAAAGLREAQLGVASDNPNALRLYERCAMTKRFRYDTYERAVVDPPNETYDTAGAPRPAGSNTRIRNAMAAEAVELRRCSADPPMYGRTIAGNSRPIPTRSSCHSPSSTMAGYASRPRTTTSRSASRL